ncbi:Bug family tripartite tricarboxylate transporter substrate binding protein [Hydrogenophaga sp. SL48]|jgi:tripartite-type tricarboxylate transporter receptor subunit TctC|uniref:Bug family tripartite tricarboxylate transporter substrate binding protein n=1 Tax=Hydrogenophaga sp. SL48 TaxID=2806347 RepID=UPI001F17D493|nr:tripartite tricarboxylate transporter substrate binding protein [Hydrogenophaga sp. SL48]UJW81036.1 tripartite tricarboxylate transporter substrate binding protein [Hydrogenophaga sp. SL48]
MTLISKRGVLQAALSLLALASTQAMAQAWPSKPVRLIVPAGAGAAPDVIARIVGEKLAAAWGQGVIVDNKPGAGGIPGMSALARSAPDGYTIGFVPAAMGTITPLVFKNPQFNPDTDLTSAATVGISPLMLAVPSSSGIQSVADLAKHAKAHPGKVNFAAPQLNSLPHLAGEMVSKAGAMGLFTVPFRAPPEAVTAVLSGDATLTVDGVPGLLQHVKSGRLRAIGVTSAKRLPGIDVPAVAETYPGYEAIGWFQIIVPAGTPAAIVERINADVNRITASPEVTARLGDMGVYPRQDSVAGAHEFFVQQQGAMKRLVNELGVQAQ